MRPPKAKNDPKGDQIKVSIEESIGNTSGLALWVDPKTVFGPYSNTKNIPFVAKKTQKTPKIANWGPQKPKTTLNEIKLKSVLKRA